jgi:hypothetical protein
MTSKDRHSMFFDVDNDQTLEVYLDQHESKSYYHALADNKESPLLVDLARAIASAKNRIKLDIDNEWINFPTDNATEIMSQAAGACIGQPHEQPGAPRTKVFKSHQASIAPFRLSVTPNGSVYFKLVYQGNVTVMTGYVEAGDTLVATAPLGCYRLRYATGAVWADENNLFKETTATFEADKELCFTRDGSELRGEQIDLTLKRSGNLSVTALDRQKF